MQKVSTAKKTEQVLNEEIESSIKKALKDAHFKEAEAGAKFAAESTKERMKQIGRAEVLKSAEYPEFIGRKDTREERQTHEKVLKTLAKLAKELESKLGDEFIAISLFGSHAKGYAGEPSDVDIRILTKLRRLNYDNEESIRNMIRHPLYNVVKYIHTINCDVRDVIGLLRWDEYSRSAVIDMEHFFEGKFFGSNSKIEEARKEIITALAKNPYGKLMWGDVRKLHEYEITNIKTLSKKDSPEVLQARERFALPSFEEMKKRYVVA